MKVDSLVWVRNFTLGVSEMIQEYTRAGYKIKAVQVSPNIYNILEEHYQSRPTDILGYRIEILGGDDATIKYVKENEAAPTDDDLSSYVGLRVDPIC